MFLRTRNIFEHQGHIENPARRISFSDISSNCKVGSVRKIKKIPSVHTHTYVGPKFQLSISNVHSERESRMGGVLLPDRINRRMLLADT